MTRNNKNNEINPNARFFRTDGQMRYHWGADDDIMTIVKRREKSPETAELVRRSVELARPGAMRPQWNRSLDRANYVQEAQMKTERREIKRVDLQPKKKEGEAHIGGGYFRIVGDEITPTRKAESTASTNSDEAVEPGVYPAIPVQNYRDWTIEDKAVHIVRKHWKNEQKKT